MSRYKLMDFEVLLKKAATLLFSYFVLACLYIVLSSRTQMFSENKLNVLILGILAMILGATLFTPLKKLFPPLFDRFFYNRAYNYRKTLLFISKELNRERNLDKLSQSLLDLITNALSLKSLALFLPERRRQPDLHRPQLKGNLPSLPQPSLSTHRFTAICKEKEYISFDSLAERRELYRGARCWCRGGSRISFRSRSRGSSSAVWAWARKSDNSFLNSEDWDLLTTISSPVALAIENASLYQQASVRALELERLKDYSENIIESLTVGVAVLDQNGRVIGWNRVLEEYLFPGQGPGPRPEPPADPRAPEFPGLLSQRHSAGFPPSE